MSYKVFAASFSAMSEEQLSALLAKLKQDAGLQERLKGSPDLDTAVTIAKDAGFDVSKEDWLSHQAKQRLELSDEELEAVSGGKGRPSVHGEGNCRPTEDRINEVSNTYISCK